MKKIMFTWGTALVIWILPLALLSGQVVGDRDFEPEFLEKRDALEEGDLEGGQDLARWCRDRGWIREMLNVLDRVLEKDPENERARRLLFQEKGKEGLRLPASQACVAGKRASPRASFRCSAK